MEDGVDISSVIFSSLSGAVSCVVNSRRALSPGINKTNRLKMIDICMNGIKRQYRCQTVWKYLE